MISQETLNKAILRLVAAANPIKVILFGSHGRGDAGEDSYLDFIVIEPHVENKGMEMVRLRHAIGNIGIGVDILVYSRKEVEEWGGVPGTALY